MGSRFSLLFAMPLLLATPVLAQQESGTEPVFNLPRTQQQPPADKQGPELDVFRGTPSTVTPPPAVTPTIQLPPPVTAPPQPAAPQPQPERRSAAPAETPRMAQPAPRPESRTPPETAAPETAAPALPENQTVPPTAPPLPAPAVAPASLPPAEPSSPWPWIGAAAALVALTAAFFWLRRRKPEEAETVEEPFSEPAPRPAPARPAAAPTPPRPEPAPAATDRPWLDLSMEVQAARLTLMGATIGYRLEIHNRGSGAANDVLVRSLIANADAQQQALFQSFFAGESGLPVHSAVAIAPGETLTLNGELRLHTQDIAAIPMGQRALLIPLIAFDAQYRWTNAAGESEGTGRTGRAFIIGEEQTPPVERLAPFRLDLGPRQYRTPGSRPTALSLAS